MQFYISIYSIYYMFLYSLFQLRKKLFLKPFSIMPSVLCLLIFFQFSFPDSSEAQVVLRRLRDAVLIDIDEFSGLQIGDQMPVIRTDNSGRYFQVGIVEVVRFQGGRCGARIVKEESGYRIMEGDRIRLYGDTKRADHMESDLDELFAPARPAARRDPRSEIIIDDKILPSFTIGAGGGFFWTALEDFDKIYKSSKLDPYGLTGSVRLAQIGIGRGIYGVIQYHLCSKSGTTVGDIKTDISWKQKFLDFGVRYTIVDNDAYRYSFGTGVSQINIFEEAYYAGRSISEDISATGLYFEVGFAFPIIESIEVFSNVKYNYTKISYTGIGLAGASPNIGGFLLISGLEFTIK